MDDDSILDEDSWVQNARNGCLGGLLVLVALFICATSVGYLLVRMMLRG